jgi:uncharacterized protein involved in exopolysaccharide biosynthesis
MPTKVQFFECYGFVRRALERHWKLAAKVSGAAVVLVVLGTLFMPRSYYSEARLFVRFGRENQVDPTAAGGQMVSLYESRESEINSLIEILKSRAILDRVVEELGPEYVLNGRSKVGGQSPPYDATRVLLAQNTATPSASYAHQQAVKQLERSAVISAPRKSNIIMVSCKASSPAVAQQIVAKLVEVYLEEHLRVHRSPGTYAFFEEQTETSRQAWQKAYDALRETKNRLGIVTIEGQRKKLEELIAQNQGQLQSNQTELKAAEGKIAAVKELIATLPEKVVTQKTAASSATFSGMRQTLYQLQAQEQELAAKMQEGHPRLVAVRQQVEDLRRILNEQPEEQIHDTEAINPSRQALELALLTESSQADALRARERSLWATREQLQGELKDFNTQAISIEQLQQQVVMAEANHKEYAQKLEQSRINRSLDEERISSLSLVQPASYVATASGPRRMLVLAVGLVVAALSGVGTALAAAWLNPFLTSGEQVSLLLDLPLTGVVPAGVFRVVAAA